MLLLSTCGVQALDVKAQSMLPEGADVILCLDDGLAMYEVRCSSPVGWQMQHEHVKGMKALVDSTDLLKGAVSHPNSSMGSPKVTFSTTCLHTWSPADNDDSNAQKASCTSCDDNVHW